MRERCGAEPPSRRAAEPQSRRAAEPSGPRASDPPCRRAANPPSRRATEQPSHRAAMPQRRNAVKLPSSPKMLQVLKKQSGKTKNDASPKVCSQFKHHQVRCLRWMPIVNRIGQIFKTWSCRCKTLPGVKDQNSNCRNLGLSQFQTSLDG